MQSLSLSLALARSLVTLTVACRVTTLLQIYNWLIADDDFSGFVEAGAPPQRLSDGNYIMTYNLLGACNCWGAGYLILDGKDPTVILQRSTVGEGGPLLWPEEPWEVTNTSATSWQPLKCFIGATNSLQPLGGDRFLAHYASGDSVAGGAIIEVMDTWSLKTK